MSYYLDQLMEDQRKKQMLADLLAQAQGGDGSPYSDPTAPQQPQYIGQQGDVRNSDNTIAALLAQQQMYAQQPNQDARDLGAMAQGPYRGESMAANTPAPRGPQAATGYIGDARDYQAQQGLQDAMNAVPLQSQAPTDLNANLSDKRIKVSMTSPENSGPIEEQLPKNYIKNNSTGKVIDMNYAVQKVPARMLGEEVDLGGGRKGNYVSKLDHTKVITADGSIINMSPIDLELTKAMDAHRIANANIEHAKSQQRIAEFNAVNGQTPAGYRRTNAGALERIPGGPPDEKQLLLEQKKQLEMANDAARIKESQGALDLLKGSTDDLLKNQNLSRITGIQGVLPNIPGLAGADAKAALESLKNKVALGAISTLKSLSANGATGLGAISNFEQKMLQQSLQSLEGSQSEEQLRKNLTFISDWTDKKNAELTDAFNARYGARTQNGAMSKDKAGRPIVNINGKWVYAS